MSLPVFSVITFIVTEDFVVFHGASKQISRRYLNWATKGFLPSPYLIQLSPNILRRARINIKALTLLTESTQH
jgi:hypothetical protein